MKAPHDVAVSVIISTYNRPRLLDRAMASVAAQTYQDFDVWVVDDCSDDERAFEAVMKKWHHVLVDRGITLYPARLPKNSGYQCVPKNAGILYSDGDHIAYLDDDNVWRPRHLEALMGAMLATETDMVYGGRHYVNDTDDTNLVTGDVAALPFDPRALAKANYIDTSDILHTRGGAWTLLREYGYIWDHNLRRFGDWNFVLRWGKAGLAGTPVDEVLTDYHWHGDNLQLTRPLTKAPMPLNESTYRKAMA